MFRDPDDVIYLLGDYFKMKDYIHLCGIVAVIESSIETRYGPLHRLGKQLLEHFEAKSALGFTAPWRVDARMARVELEMDRIDLDQSTLVEGLPGVGLVGKITTDHLVETLDMEYYASVHCEGVPPVAAYRAENPDIQPPIRVYVDVDRDLLALQSDIPVSPSNAPEFAECITNWLTEYNATPFYLSGLPADKEGGTSELYGVSTGAGSDLLAEAGIETPPNGGVISGPVGALLYEAREADLNSVGLIVESNPQFPDPEAAQTIIRDGFEPMTGIEVDTDALVDQAEQIQSAQQQLAQRMQQAEDESSQVQPLRMFQ